jgi:dihydrofolate reductase
VIRQFLSANLIDDLTLSIVPIVLREGVRLFAGGEGEHTLAFDSSQAWPTGLVQLRYRLPAP